MTILGLTFQDMQDVRAVFEELPQVSRVWPFGSRAKGTAPKGSDVDLALEGPEVDLDTVLKVDVLLNEETNLANRFDVLGKALISSAELLDQQGI